MSKQRNFRILNLNLFFGGGRKRGRKKGEREGRRNYKIKIKSINKIIRKKKWENV